MLDNIMTIRQSFTVLNKRIQLQGDAAQYEQTDAWSNRDLIPLPPSRRTWGWFNFFGFWSIASLNLANWQTPNTYLSRLT
jgi:NCS1 family nucleobase:cation symporter-1